MGRGKKKGDKKGEKEKAEEPSLSSLTLSESQPSTSTVAPAEEEGLTGGRKKAPKKQSTPEVPGPPEPSTVVSAPPESVALVQEEESEGLGLGGGRRKPRKKKGAAKAEAAVEPSEPPVTTTHAKPIQEVPTSVVPPPGQAATWGHGRGTQPAPQTPQVASREQPVLQPSPRPGQPSGPRTSQPSGPPPGQASGPPPSQPSGLRPGQPSGPPPGRPSGPRPAQQRGPWAGQEFGLQPSQKKQAPQAPVSTQVQPPVPVFETQTPRQSPSKSAICRFKIPDKKPGNNVPYRAVRVITNYLPMKIKALKIHRYDVAFKPDKPKKMIPKAYELAKGILFPKSVIAFDQMKNCYSLNALPKVPLEDRLVTNVEVVDNNGKPMKFEVSFKYTGVVDLGTILDYMSTGGTSLNPPTEAIQCVDIILRQGTLQSYVKAGRQFFKRPSAPINLGHGLEMWTGLFQSAIFTSRPYINIDVAHKGFPKNQPLLKTMVEDFRIDLRRPLDQQRGYDIDLFHGFLKGLRVIASIGGDKQGQKREFICNGVGEPANRQMFTMTDASGREKKISVADYFQKEKGCRLQYPHLNCMWVGPRDKSIYYPIELLDVSYGQALNKQLNERQLQTMVKEAAAPPVERKAKITEVMKDMQYSSNPYFKQFGLEIENKFFEVEAKVLKPPLLNVGDRQSIEPRTGSWQTNRVYKPEPLKSWGFIGVEVSSDSCDFGQIESLLMNCGRQMGMNVAPPKLRRFNVSLRELPNVLFSALENEINFLFVIISSRGRDHYHKIKQVAECEVGILTQCIKEMTASRRMNPQTAKNILLKVNSKLMGVNQILDGRCMPNCLKGGWFMVVGADVTHPSPDQSSIPSIAAVTASVDRECFRYNITLSIQAPTKEMIVEFEEMMVEHLQLYRQNLGNLPKKIYVFRDGVSEGQFAQVMNSELQAVYNAHQRLTGTTAKPEVLFLLVQKRHHTRLFTTHDKPQNVEPGTVVDREIVHARELDFYLVSHQAIKGTARPTRYHAVCNDGAIPDDEVEQLTYYLCHLYSRCMRSVSYPTPTYYAHLACMRARSLTYGQKFDNKELEKKPRRLKVLDKMLSYSRMFFV